MSARSRKLIWGLVVVLTPVAIYASNLTIPNSFNSGTAIVSAQVNTNFAAVQTAVNSKQDALTTGSGLSLSGATLSLVNCPANDFLLSNGSAWACAAAPAGGLGTTASNPATSCSALLSASPSTASGIYWLQPSTAKASFQAYCDMTTAGGGWTLVWSNLRGGRAKPVTEIQFNRSVDTLPVFAGQPSADLESFTVFTGLAHWAALAPVGQIRYDWEPDYKGNIDQRWSANFTLTTAKYVMTLSAPVQSVGNTAPGLSGISGTPWSAYDQKNDVSASACSPQYGNTPWWYSNCWNGSMNGGGESSGSGYYNGAYWAGAALQWGVSGGTGAGNGWMYVK